MKKEKKEYLKGIFRAEHKMLRFLQRKLVTLRVLFKGGEWMRQLMYSHLPQENLQD